MKSNTKFNLTNEEMNELVGGLAPQGAADDIVNKNRVSGCGCFFNNSLQVINDPESTCTCTNPK